jgi:hypothetical protein
MNVNEKGSIGLIEVIRDLTKSGYECFTPIHDYSAVDLIVLVDKKPIRLQVKYREQYRNKITIDFRSIVGRKSVPINMDCIDGWAVYCPEIEKIVYVSKQEINLNKKGFSFRFESGGNQVNSDKEKLKLYTEFGKLDEWFKSAPC